MKAATLIMGCGHEATYGSPFPIEGELGWCHRCQDFKTVARVKQINLDQPNLTDGYQRHIGITHCTNGELRYSY